MSEQPVLSIYESTFAPSNKTVAILVVEGKKLHVNKAVLSYHSDYFDALFNGEIQGKNDAVTMSVTSIYESEFAKSDKTDAILVVDGRKLHVNKAHLSYHSDYFNTLFNGDFKEKSMPEIEIKDVKFEDFATLLSLVHPNPIKPEAEACVKLLELADRFMLPGVKPYIELVLLRSQIHCTSKISIGAKYGLDDLLDNGLSLSKSEDWLQSVIFLTGFKELPEATQLKIALKIIKIADFSK
ncbi:hypothetical protein CRE_19768 [Caenorhabditis remanei]|uniref:BTB domain-containing protein n=1 Tax=Caenorhabditis remanei TaxID=31234 RepID=E3MTP7_CAERE|nr:hypothetical protein CRE_19768 [Caenorhabditis remanei]